MGSPHVGLSDHLHVAHGSFSGPLEELEVSFSQDCLAHINKIAGVVPQNDKLKKGATRKVGQGATAGSVPAVGP